MKWGAIIIFIAFAGISIFGLLTMQMSTGHMNCMVNPDCGTSPFAAISEHFSFFGSLSNAIFFSIIVLLILAAISAIVAIIRFAESPPRLGSAYSSPEPPNPSRDKFFSWITFHENSPSYA